MRLFPFVLLLVVAGCAAPSAPVPVDARLGAWGLAVTLADGTVCRADRPEGIWEGGFEGCPALSYRVETDPAPNFLRRLWVGAMSGLQLDEALVPLARITVTGQGGARWIFVSPVRVARGW